MYVQATKTYGSLIPGSEYVRSLIRQGTISKDEAKRRRWRRSGRPSGRIFNLRCFYERPARGKGANKAKVAMVRRLLTIIYKVWKEGRNYVAYRR